MKTLTVSDTSRRSVSVWGNALGLGLRGALAVLLFVVSLMAATQFSPVTQSSRQPDPAQILLALLGTGSMYTVALAYPVIRSRWTGWRLVAGLFVAYAGITPVLLQVETLVFLMFLVPVVPADVLQRIILNGFITALLFTPMVVLVFGKMRGPSNRSRAGKVPQWPQQEWIWKFVLIGAIYAVIYFGFGTLVAVPLAGQAFNEYYHDLQVPIWMPLFQMARGAFWALIMLPVIKMMGGRWWEGGLAVALLSSFLTAALLLNQNDFMPEAMRFAHSFELLSSNFVFGWAIFWLFHRHHDSFRDLFPAGRGMRRDSRQPAE